TGVLLSLKSNLFIGFAASVVLGMLSIYLGTRQLMRQTQITDSFLFSYDLFQDWVNRWTVINNSFVEMLPDPQHEITAAEVSSDVTAYSFDRVVVCDSSVIAQLLIANNFHFEYNCAVLSITGYPKGIFETVMQMLRRNTNLTVYALHDASPQGITLINFLRTSPNWFTDSNVTIYDLGLRPRQVLGSPSFFVIDSENSAREARQLSLDVRRELSAEEVAWLESGKYVELESFTPKKILQVVAQGINKSQFISSQDNQVSSDLVGYDRDSDSDSSYLILFSDRFG
ncbi:MAG: MFS transporter permease, partial [Coleofasciculaceae cyanobacterium]